MERLGGRERVLEQMYTALLTKRDATIELALRAYGSACTVLCMPWRPCVVQASGLFLNPKPLTWCVQLCCGICRGCQAVAFSCACPAGCMCRGSPSMPQTMLHMCWSAA